MDQTVNVEVKTEANEEVEVKTEVKIEGDSTLTFATTIDESFIKCDVCLEIMHTPISVSRCSHNFCAACLYRWLDDHHSCPRCRVVVKDVSKDVIVTHICESFAKSHPDRIRSEESLIAQDQAELEYLEKLLSRSQTYKESRPRNYDEEPQQFILSFYNQALPFYGNRKLRESEWILRATTLREQLALPPKDYNAPEERVAEPPPLFRMTLGDEETGEELEGYVNNNGWGVLDNGHREMREMFIPDFQGIIRAVRLSPPRAPQPVRRGRGRPNRNQAVIHAALERYQAAMDNLQQNDDDDDDDDDEMMDPYNRLIPIQPQALRAFQIRYRQDHLEREVMNVAAAAQLSTRPPRAAVVRRSEQIERVINGIRGVRGRPTARAANRTVRHGLVPRSMTGTLITRLNRRQARGNRAARAARAPTPGALAAAAPPPPAPVVAPAPRVRHGIYNLRSQASSS